MRYAGQNYELPIPLPDGDIGPATLDTLAEAFAAAHLRMYGFIAEEDPVQLVTFRVEASGIVPKASFAPHPDAGPDASGAIVARRDVWLPEAGGFVACAVYDRAAFGPAIASAVPPSSSRWMRQRWCCRAWSRGSNRTSIDLGAGMNDALLHHHAVDVDPITVEVIGSALVVDHRGDGRGADPRVLFH